MLSDNLGRKASKLRYGYVSLCPKNVYTFCYAPGRYATGHYAPVSLCPRSLCPAPTHTYIQTYTYIYTHVNVHTYIGYTYKNTYKHTLKRHTDTLGSIAT